MQLIVTGGWSVPAKEAEATNSLADNGVDGVACHIDDLKVVLQTADKRGIHSCGLNVDQRALAPKGYLTGALYNWKKPYGEMIADMMGGKDVPHLLRGGFAEGFVEMGPFGDAATGPVRQAVEKAAAELASGKRFVFSGPLKDSTGKVILEAGPPHGRHRPGAPVDELPGRGRERHARLKLRRPSDKGGLKATMAVAAELLLIPLGALAAAGIVFGIVVALLGVDPRDVYALMWLGGFGTWFSWQNTLVRAAPLLLTALCFALPAQMGFAIIGGEGAFVLGGLGAVVASHLAPAASSPVVWALMAAGGMVAGAAIVGLSGALRVWRGVNETISSLLLTYLAIALFNQLVEGPLRDPSDLNRPSTFPIPLQGAIGTIPGTAIHWGLAIGIVACVVAVVVIYRTGTGFAMRVLGGNGRAARMVGISAKRLTIGVFCAAGAIAGLGGMIDVAAIDGKANSSLVAGYGYTGILVAFIARQNPLLIIPVAVLLGGIGASGGLVQRRLGLPYASVLVLQGIIFFIVLVAETLRGRGLFADWDRRVAILPDPLNDTQPS